MTPRGEALRRLVALSALPRVLGAVGGGIIKGSGGGLELREEEGGIGGEEASRGSGTAVETRKMSSVKFYHT